MRLIDVQEDGILELRWMYLPMFIAQNYAVMKELQDVVNKEYAGKDLVTTSLMLDTMDRFVIKWLCSKFKMIGLDEFLNGLSHIRMEGDNDAIPIQENSG